MYSVYQHWDPLKVCIVGRSYPAEFYSWIKIAHVRKLFEKIAEETEEDYQNVIRKLQEFGVQVLRPNLPKNPLVNGQYLPPPMTPRDYTVMIGDVFYENYKIDSYVYADILNHIRSQGNTVKSHNNTLINGSMVSRIGQDLYFGTESYHQNIPDLQQIVDNEFPTTRNHIVNTGGHSDGTYCPVCPGLIISLRDVPTYADTYPGWEVIYLPKEGWEKVEEFVKLKRLNKGRWWIPGFETDHDVVNVVETWLNHWTGYVEETVFDVNMLVLDPKNVMVFNYNEQVFKALDRYNITPHVVPFRHRYFWDGGIHCVTSDLHREGSIKNFFPERDR
jgi:hypothetical protein